MTFWVNKKKCNISLFKSAFKLKKEEEKEKARVRDNNDKASGSEALTCFSEAWNINNDKVNLSSSFLNVGQK